MTTLSSVTQLTRKALEYSAIAIVSIILLVILFNIGTFVKEMISPTPPPPPTVAFGKLPVPTFPLTTATIPTSYVINTLTGQLPSLPDRVNVYKMKSPSSDLLSLDKAKAMASSIGFTDSPISLSDTAYQWTKTDPFRSILTINTLSFNFTYTSSFLSDPTIMAAASLPDEQGAIKAAQDFFSTISPLPGNIDPDKTKTTLLAIDDNGLTSATSFSNAQIIRVDFFPKVVDTYQLYTAHPTTGLVYALVASGDTPNPQVVEAQEVHKDISSTHSTYPIKTAQQAFEDLKKGNGYIASNPGNASNVSITNVTLGYFLSDNQQDFLLPIIIFQGDSGFFAYVSALNASWNKTN